MCSSDLEVVVGADLRVDVVVDMSLGLVEITEGDPAVDAILEWKIELLLTFELLQELVKLSS